MVKEIAFENNWISNFEGLLTLTLVRVILHTVMHRSSTSTYMPHFIEIEETFGVWMDGHLRPALLGGFCRRVDLKTSSHQNESGRADVESLEVDN